TLARRKIVVLGAGRKAGIFNDALRRRADRRGLNIVGFVPLPGTTQTHVEARTQLHVRTSLASLCARSGIQEIVIATDDDGPELPAQDLLECRFRGIPVTQAASFIERECGRIPVELADHNWWLFRDGFSESLFNRVVKRGFDI